MIINILANIPHLGRTRLLVFEINFLYLFVCMRDLVDKYKGPRILKIQKYLKPVAVTSLKLIIPVILVKLIETYNSSYLHV